MSYTEGMPAGDAKRHLRELAAAFPVVAITGPRQSGKTTLVRMEFKKKPINGARSRLGTRP
jgi:predicted AAA+ superfamily ATPase